MCLNDTFAEQARSRIKLISLESIIMLGRRLLCFDFQTAYLKMSMTSPREPDWSLIISSEPYQYIFLKWSELMSGGGTKARVHWKRRLLVTGQLRKKWTKLSRTIVSRSIILQNVHKGETSLSNAFILLFSGRELLWSRNKKFRRSFPKKRSVPAPQAFGQDRLSGRRDTG